MYISLRWRDCTCGREDSSNDATESDQKLPERHVLLRDMDHQGADVILHEDARHTMAACGMVDLPLLHNRGGADYEHMDTQTHMHRRTENRCMATDMHIYTHTYVHAQ